MQFRFIDELEKLQVVFKTENNTETTTRNDNK